MMTLGPFARKPLAACLLLCAIVMASPTSAFAKDYIVNGRDGAEGDPGDGLDYIGGGGLSGLPDENVTFDSTKVVIIVNPTMLVYVSYLHKRIHYKLGYENDSEAYYWPYKETGETP